jgi:1-acyl-sn-glycerol-3-phosphate acyltransferase
MAAIVANALPFDRHYDPRESLALSRHVLENAGNILILFPEGSRSDTGELRPFKPGVGLVLAGSDVAVLPCYLDGAFAAWPKGRMLPRPRSIRLTIGTPRRYPHLPRNKQGAMEICQDLHDAVAGLADSTSATPKRLNLTETVGWVKSSEPTSPAPGGFRRLHPPYSPVPAGRIE